MSLSDERRQAAAVSDLPAPLARLLWRQHTVYRERGGTVVIRGEDAGRWISLTAHGVGRVRVRTGRILDGGTTAPARAETTVPLDGDIARLAACCRALLAETADAGTPGTQAPAPARGGRSRNGSRSGSRNGSRKGFRRGRSGRGTTVLVCAAVVVGLIAASMFG